MRVCSNILSLPLTSVAAQFCAFARDNGVLVTSSYGVTMVDRGKPIYRSTNLINRRASSLSERMHLDFGDKAMILHVFVAHIEGMSASTIALTAVEL